MSNLAVMSGKDRNHVRFEMPSEACMRSSAKKEHYCTKEQHTGAMVFKSDVHTRIAVFRLRPDVPAAVLPNSKPLTPAQETLLRLQQQKGSFWV